MSIEKLYAIKAAQYDSNYNKTSYLLEKADNIIDVVFHRKCLIKPRKILKINEPVLLI